MWHLRFKCTVVFLNIIVYYYFWILIKYFINRLYNYITYIIKHTISEAASNLSFLITTRDIFVFASNSSISIIQNRTFVWNVCMNFFNQNDRSISECIDLSLWIIRISFSRTYWRHTDYDETTLRTNMTSASACQLFSPAARSYRKTLLAREHVLPNENE